MKNDELHIITSILAGKTERFSYFLDTYGQQIFTLIVRMVGSPEDAEELTQDTFMKAFRHLSDFNGKSSFSTWLYRIAYNTALSSLRKQPNEVLSVDDRLWNNLTENEIDRALDEEDEERIEQLSQIVTFADVQGVDIHTALMSSMPDFEDAVVDAVAERNGASYILTRNIKDFAGSSVPAITPTEFLKK